jgi:hypothetical protein
VKDAEREIRIPYRDFQRMRLFVYELQRLYEEMVRTENPMRPRLEGLLDRFMASTETDR